jgi:hypothetical protein
MAVDKNLGRLEPVDLREIWDSESGDFTPWLAQEGNLALLGDAIGIDLELEAQEKDVGPFRADILCKDGATNGWVVIENQLEWTDHTHLGQLLTYAAGLKAAAVLWIAKQFTDEHRAALDWLNEIAGESTAFFGVQIELWRIADSPHAPRFNVVSRPNASSKAVRKSTEGALSELKLLQRDYWAGLRLVLLERKSVVSPRTPPPGKWTTFKVGRSGFRLYAGIDLAAGNIQAGLSADYCLKPLENAKDAIERELNSPLDWGDGDDDYQWVGLSKDDVDPANRDDWPSQHLWLAEKLEALHKAFAPRIKALDLDEQQEPDDE